MKIVIVGGGTAGITVAAQLRRKSPQAEVVIIDPSSRHFYQPLWTLVGGGLVSFQETERVEEDLIPDGVKWLQDKVLAFSPNENQLRTESNGIVSYDQLIVAPGLSLALNEVKGLTDALNNDPRVWTNYDRRYVRKGNKVIQALKSGPAIFTTPDSPIKCGGAPQKIMWVAEEWFRKNGIRDSVEVTLTVPGGDIFGVPKYRDALDKLASERNVALSTHLHLIEVDSARSLAIFENLKTGEVVKKEYALLHVTPPQRAPEFIRTSPLADSACEAPEKDQSPAIVERNIKRGARGGFVDIDQHTLRHKKYSNVWSLGDACNAPTAKTGAAVRKQAPVLVANLLASLKGDEPSESYNGYTSCPLVVGHHQVILAEFGYGGEVMETFPYNQAKPRYSSWFLKRHLLPKIYWYGMLKGWM